MNKIVLDKEKKELENVEGIIEDISNLKEIIFKGNNKVILKPISDINLNIILNDEATLDLSLFLEDTKLNTKLYIIQENNTKFILKESISSNNKINVQIINKVKGYNNTSNIKLRCISFKEKMQISVLADVSKESYNNEIIEDIKGLNEGGIVSILPKMEINTNEVMANHYVTIGKVSNTDLFYLKSKGLSENVAKNLILNGFLKGIMEVKKDE